MSARWAAVVAGAVMWNVVAGQLTITALTSGVPVTNTLETGQFAYYSYSWNGIGSGFVVQVQPLLYGDPDVQVNANTAPTVYGQSLTGIIASGDASGGDTLTLGSQTNFPSGPSTFYLRVRAYTTTQFYVQITAIGTSPTRTPSPTPSQTRTPPPSASASPSPSPGFATTLALTGTAVNTNTLSTSQDQYFVVTPSGVGTVSFVLSFPYATSVTAVQAQIGLSGLPSCRSCTFSAAVTSTISVAGNLAARTISVTMSNPGMVVLRIVNPQLSSVAMTVSASATNPSPSPFPSFTPLPINATGAGSASTGFISSTTPQNVYYRYRPNAYGRYRVELVASGGDVDLYIGNSMPSCSTCSFTAIASSLSFGTYDSVTYDVWTGNVAQPLIIRVYRYSGNPVSYSLTVTYVSSSDGSNPNTSSRPAAVGVGIGSALAAIAAVAVGIYVLVVLCRRRAAPPITRPPGGVTITGAPPGTVAVTTGGNNTVIVAGPPVPAPAPAPAPAPTPMRPQDMGQPSMPYPTAPGYGMGPPPGAPYAPYPPKSPASAQYGGLPPGVYPPPGVGYPPPGTGYPPPGTGYPPRGMGFAPAAYPGAYPQPPMMPAGYGVAPYPGGGGAPYPMGGYGMPPSGYGGGMVQATAGYVTTSSPTPTNNNNNDPEPPNNPPPVNNPPPGVSL